MTCPLAGTQGLGEATLVALAQHNPGHLYFTGRSKSRADEVIVKIKAAAPSVPVTFLECDLGSCSSVVEALKQFKSERLDTLILNAGIMATPPSTTRDGHEVQFGTNHVGHFAVLVTLLPVLEKTASQGHDVRVVTLSSLGYRHYPPGGVDLDTLNTDQAQLSKWQKYGQSKLANLLMGRELARRKPGITSVMVHPGVVYTNLVGSLPAEDKAFIDQICDGKYLTPEEGAHTQLWAATTKRENLKSGCFYVPVGVETELLEEAANNELARKLWEWSESEMVKLGVKSH